MALPTALVIAGLGAQTLGSIQAGQDKEAALRRKTLLQIEKGEEILERAETNSQAARQQGERVAARQLTKLAGAGIDATSESALMLMERTANDVADSVSNIMSEARDKAELAFDGAEATRRAAENVDSQTRLKVLSDLALGGLKASQNFPKKGTLPDSGGNSSILGIKKGGNSLENSRLFIGE